LKAERDGVTEAFLREKENLIMYEKELEELKMEEEYLEESIADKQNNLKEIEMIIQESESNYSKVGFGYWLE
jgi:chromosome segregation ATPase